MSKFRDFDKYEIYEDGRIWSYKYKKFLKHQTSKDGYQRVNLYDNEGKQKWYQLHRVVYEAVTGEPIPKGLEVNHIDEDITNNKFSNLNLLTRKENINWGTGIERRAKTHSKLNKNGKLSKQVGAFKNGELVMVFPSTREAHRQGFNKSSVSACCRNCFNRPGNNVYKGYTWKYI